MVKEIDFIGSFRYADVFDEAIQLVHSGKIDLKPFISGVLSIKDVSNAMNMAGDKINALKIQLQF
jgi:L-idonate 5-dehydrogenase